MTVLLIYRVSFAVSPLIYAGKLPDFTWLQPQTTTYGHSLANWQHPDASVMEGKNIRILLLDIVSMS